MTSCGYENLIYGPTYVSPANLSEVSCVDHIWTNLANIDSHGYVIKPNLSDHYAVCIMLDTYAVSRPISVKFRDFSPGNIDKFESNAAREFSAFDPSINDVNENANSLV